MCLPSTPGALATNSHHDPHADEHHPGWRGRFEPEITPQPRLREDEGHFILTAFGADRIGLVAELAEKVASFGANISASKIITVGDDICVMMVVSAPKDQAEQLRLTGLIRQHKTQTKERAQDTDKREHKT